MFRKLIYHFIRPTQTDEDLRNRELVLNVLLVGTLIIETLALCILVASYTVWGNHYVLVRIGTIVAAVLFTAANYWLSRTGKYKPAAWMLLATYTLFAGGVSLAWGITMPVSVALYGLLIILFGILLGARYALMGAGISIAIILLLQTYQNNGSLNPDLYWTDFPLDIVTVIGFCIVFGMVGLVTWLFNVRMEHSLARAQRAEADLQRQRDTLETTVQERTRELEAAQLERMQQLYRFAELGQLSTGLMHELAGHLTTLSLDIEGLESKEHSLVVKRAKRSIRYIDDMVLRVRDQLQGKLTVRIFDAAAEIEDVITILKSRAIRLDVSLQFVPPASRKDLKLKGDSVRFRQLMANIIANAIDAYDGLKPAQRHPRQVQIEAKVKGKELVITVADWGKGITPQNRDRLFQPFYSTKVIGMGMGLSIARQIADGHFGGRLYLDDATTPTRFVIILPKA